MKKRINLFVCLLLLAAWIAVPNTTAYAKDDITGIKLEAEMRAMIERGVIQGFGPGKYEPYLNVTRGQFAAFITRALDLPEGPAVFTDVPKTSRLFTSINSASAAGIVNGYTKTTFGPNDPISREQASAMIDNAMKYKGIIRSEATLDFSDAAQISNAFKPAVAKNAKDGIIRGIPNSDGTFRFAPKKTASRAEA
ncbi:MAG TPA: S-layer homology domain-containing protein, partial [Pseudoneobacillus sp.]|nr:S-layer homology domain-containing protein [Pseudoneobacillus sp.]